MDQAAIVIFVIIAIISFLYHLSASAAASDPANSAFADSSNLDRKLAEQIDPTATYKVYVMRQSGNVERYYENVTGCNVPSLVTPVVRRAKIDTVSISGGPGQIKVWRTMHNHRGRNEGKKIGGFKIVLQSV